MNTLHLSVALVTVGILSFVGCGSDDSAAGEVRTLATDSPSSASHDAVPLVVVGIGDSIQTSTDDNGDTFLDAYAGHLEAATGRAVEVTSFADGGSTSDSVRASLVPGSPEVEAVSTARLVVVTVGGNDADPFGDYPTGTCSVDTSAAACLRAYAPKLGRNLDSILGRLDRSRGAQTVVVITSPDYNPFVGWSEAPTPTFGADFYRQVAGAETRLVCRLAERHDARCLDLFHLFNGASGAEDPADFLAADHAHPGPLGIRVIADALAELMDS